MHNYSQYSTVSNQASSYLIQQYAVLFVGLKYIIIMLSVFLFTDYSPSVRANQLYLAQLAPAYIASYVHMHTYPFSGTIKSQLAGYNIMVWENTNFLSRGYTVPDLKSPCHSNIVAQSMQLQLFIVITAPLYTCTVKILLTQLAGQLHNCCEQLYS